jgi:hypothetical protein
MSKRAIGRLRNWLNVVANKQDYLVRYRRQLSNCTTAEKSTAGQPCHILIAKC